MFDIGFWELAVVGVIALLVIGPERLPRVAYTAGLWLGKARRFIASVKADIDQEIKAEELKQILKKQAESSGVHEIIEETRSAAEELKKPLEELNKPASEHLHSGTQTAANAPQQSKRDEAPSGESDHG